MYVYDNAEQPMERFGTCESNKLLKVLFELQFL